MIQFYEFDVSLYGYGRNQFNCLMVIVYCLCCDGVFVYLLLLVLVFLQYLLIIGSISYTLVILLVLNPSMDIGHILYSNLDNAYTLVFILAFYDYLINSTHYIPILIYPLFYLLSITLYIDYLFIPRNLSCLLYTISHMTSSYMVIQFNLNIISMSYLGWSSYWVVQQVTNACTGPSSMCCSCGPHFRSRCSSKVFIYDFIVLFFIAIDFRMYSSGTNYPVIYYAFTYELLLINIIYNKLIIYLPNSIYVFRSEVFSLAVYISWKYFTVCLSIVNYYLKLITLRVDSRLVLLKCLYNLIRYILSYCKNDGRSVPISMYRGF